MGEQTTYITKKKLTNNKKELFYFEKSEFDKIIKIKNSWLTKKKTLSNMLRINILYMIQNAGSGHIGTSFSSIDLFNNNSNEIIPTPKAISNKLNIVLNGLRIIFIQLNLFIFIIQLMY